MSFVVLAMGRGVSAFFSARILPEAGWINIMAFAETAGGASAAEAVTLKASSSVGRRTHLFKISTTLE